MSSPRPNPAETARPAGPGRPKDLGKRAAILLAAKRMFVQHGFEGVSMDQIAAEAGVSKLTVYSHFGDKGNLFSEAVRAHCEESIPAALFDPAPGVPLRERLTQIGRAFVAMVMTPDAIAAHRILCAPQVAGSDLATILWEAGPQRLHASFAALLERRMHAGELDIPDPARATGHFFTLLKGEPHSQAVFGFCGSGTPQDPDAHVASVVDLFLRAYAVR
ncbi:TetR/AcrR family transcriptional regulator [Thermomonas brevis]